MEYCRGAAIVRDNVVVKGALPSNQVVIVAVLAA